MSLRLQILVSMILHMATFALLGLGSIYESKLLTFSALASLMIGLFFSKEVLVQIEPENPTEIDEIDEDPPLGIG